MWVAVADDPRGEAGAPVVQADGGEVRFSAEPTPEGVWPLLVTPGPSARRVALLVRRGEEERTVVLPVRAAPPAALRVPERVEAVARGGPVELLIQGPSLPPPHLLDVQPGEGRVLSVEPTAEGLMVNIELSDSSFPRVFSVGLRDRRGRTRPAWTEVRVRARPRVPIDGPPGSRVEVRVGERVYGPERIGDDGRAVLRIDHYPGESAALAVVTDDLGNVGESPLPLAASELPALVLIPGERLSAGSAPRTLWLRAVHPSGKPWSEEPPTCRSATGGVLPVTQVAPGEHAVPIEVPGRTLDADLRVECRLREATVEARVGPTPNVPTRVLLQVWPTELSTDLPVADIRAAVEDARGQRLPVEDLELSAARGSVQKRRAEGGLLLAEYIGERAIDAGTDTLRARYLPQPAEGEPASLWVAWDEVPREGEVAVRLGAWDEQGRPVRGAPVRLDVGDGWNEGVADATGEARLTVPLPAGGLPVELRVVAGGVELRGLAHRGSGAARVQSGSGGASLDVSREVVLSPGKVTGISVTFDPPVLRTGGNSVAWVLVALEDRRGRPVPDEQVRLEVSEGQVGPLVARPDGTLVAEYRPARSDRPREVTVTASTDAVRTSGRLTLEPRLARMMVGPQVGWVSNLGLVSGPYLAADVDIRTSLLAETVLVRASVGGYAVRGAAQTGTGAALELDGTVLPGVLALLLRQERAGVAVWGGAGAGLAVHLVRGRFGSTELGRGAQLLSGGAVLGGVGYRVGAGELAAEARWSVLRGGRGELGFTGNLGGVSAGLGYRFVY